MRQRARAFLRRGPIPHGAGCSLAHSEKHDPPAPNIIALSAFVARSTVPWEAKVSEGMNKIRFEPKRMSVIVPSRRDEPCAHLIS